MALAVVADTNSDFGKKNGAPVDHIYFIAHV